MPITYDCPELEHGDRALLRIGYNKLHQTALIPFYYDTEVSYVRPVIATYYKHDGMEYFINYVFVMEPDEEGYLHFVERPDYYFFSETDRSKWNDWMHKDGLEPHYNTTTTQVTEPTMEEGSVDRMPLCKFEWALIYE